MGARGEKAQSVDVCPWESQPPTKKAPSTMATSPKEAPYTTLAPTGGPSPVSERRASEGVLRMALGVCPLEDVIQRARQRESEVKISVEEGRSGDLGPSPLDLTVRSGHLRGILGLQGDPPPPPISALELSIATSMAALTCPTSAEDTGPVERPQQETPPGPLQPQQQQQQQPPPSQQMSPMGDREVHITPVEPLVVVPLEEGEGSASPRRSPNVVAPWDDE